ncbi:MAG: UDP-3-O-(3-hydroxymyristoyl)glucosamine N-acyltransferase [Schleiferiaceae bacterium]|nr:UDP-3-O-(3-hydroxymyristoyl)glucosamine N-acyltransferase [Schleiferiaceae bacterium]
MKFKNPQTLKAVAEIINCQYKGDENHLVLGMNEIHVVDPGDIVFVDHPKYYDKALNSAATTILINKDVECPEGKGLLISDDPFRDFNALSKHFSPKVHSNVNISESAQIDPSAVLYPGVFVGNNVQIGKNTVIHPNVSIYDNCIIGDNVVIHSNTVLGADAFYYKKRPEGFDQLISTGKVVIEDQVHIGASCTIDRGVSGETRIGKGTKLDNHIQIGHDTKVGENCLFASQVGVAGCVVIKNNVTLWGQVGVKSDVTLEDNVVVYAQSGVGKDLAPGAYFGSPADDARVKYREMASIKILPKIISDIGKQ